jgi:hypothetical protein
VIQTGSGDSPSCRLITASHLAWAVDFHRMALEIISRIHRQDISLFPVT